MSYLAKLDLSIILTVGLLMGQLFKFPAGSTGGLTILDLAVVILDILLLVKLKFRLPKLPLYIKTALIFLVVTVLSLIFTPLNLSQTEYLISFAYILRLAAYFLLGWLIFQNFRPTLIFSGVILSILGLLQLIFLPNLGFLASLGWDPHYFRTVSTLLDPNFLGAYLALTLLLISQTKFNSKLKIASFIIVYLALVTTFSRSGALVMGVIFLTLSLLQRSIKLGAVTIILTAGFFLGFQTYHQQVAAPRNIDRTKSAESRLSTWQQGFEMFTAHPILGVGFNSYRFALEKYQLAPKSVEGSRGGSTNDSSLLFVASTTGLIGLITYLVFLVSLLKVSFKRNPVLFSGIVGLILGSFFVNSLFYPWMLIWIMALLPTLLPKTPKN